MPTGRLEAFSDGVFAIAITLLVLELEVPDGTSGLLSELGEQWASYVGYFVSFAFIGGAWMAHSNLTRFLRATDQVLLGLNLVLLLLVSLLPFTTSLLATHLGDTDEQVAVVIFGLNLALASVMVNVMFRYAAVTRGLSDATADAELRSFDRSRRRVVFVQLAAAALGLFLPAVAVGLYLVISVLLLLDPIWRARRSKRAAGDTTR
jgi:uncharacterized membrane protein